jgi:hypothetical protein
MPSLTRAAAAAVFTLLLAQPALAQEPRFSAAVNGGLTIENSEDGLTGTVAALGATASVGFSQWWRGEVELWLPRYLEDGNGEPKHRDILLSFSAVRTFRAGPTRPFLLAGFSFSQTQDWFTFCTAPRNIGGTLTPALVSCDEPDVVERRRERNDGTDGYALLGGGVEIPVGSRVRIVGDVRFSLAPVSVLVRPAVGVAFTF